VRIKSHSPDPERLKGGVIQYLEFFRDTFSLSKKELESFRWFVTKAFMAGANWFKSDIEDNPPSCEIPPERMAEISLSLFASREVESITRPGLVYEDRALLFAEVQRLNTLLTLEQNSFFVLNLDRSTTCAMWLKPNQKGYTPEVRHAGVFDLESALDAALSGRGRDVPVTFEAAQHYESALLARTTLITLGK